jgi:hypothetical protein
VRHRPERVIEPLLRPKHLYCAAELLIRPSPVPKSPGVYAWYFDKLPPGIPKDRYHKANGHTLLYVGIAPMKRINPRTRPSTRTLHHRLRDHFARNAEGSTLRKTLGCLLSDTLDIRLRRVGNGHRQTFTNPGERQLDKWMAQHARVTVAGGRRFAFQSAVAAEPSGLPPFVVPTLKSIRKAAREAAIIMDVVVDNGGPRGKNPKADRTR